MRIDLRKRVFINFVLVIALFGVVGALLGASLISRTAEREAQGRVQGDLRSAWEVLDSKAGELQRLVDVLAPGRRVEEAYASGGRETSQVSLEQVRQQFQIDFFSVTDSRGRVTVRSREPYAVGDDVSNDPFVSKALQGESARGLTVLSAERLKAEGSGLAERAFIRFEQTPRAKKRAKDAESAGMVLMAASPVIDQNGDLRGVLYAGLLLNRDDALVDHVRSTVFEDELYGGKQLGTVTVFQWDVRVATNVIRPNGNRAIGTRVSEEVYDRVLGSGESWHDRAFVVDDWYITAYDPIRDVEGKIVGMLYVGVLAKKYDDMTRRMWQIYGGLALAAAAVVLVLGLVFAHRLTGSLARLAQGAGRIAEGNLTYKVAEPASDDEVRDLTRAFNAMATSLHDREEKLKLANAELEQLNSNYLDMLGFVSHELKNKLGVVFTAARALDAGMVGELAEAQAKLVGSIKRSIVTAVGMTRNYLDLARIEKGELRVEKQETDLVRDVVAPVLDELEQAIADRGVGVESGLGDSLAVTGDPALLRIVYGNLIGNALNYGRQGGKIRLGVGEEGGYYRLEVWNEGDGISREDIETLFGKFVRLRDGRRQMNRGTGLGLFITKSIVEEHGGRICVESDGKSWVSFIFTLPRDGDKG